MENKTTVSDTVSHQEKLWATFAHLSAFVTFVIPLGNIIAPLIIWLVKKEEMPLVNSHGKESLNFQISTTIYMIIAAMLSILLIGIPILIAIIILWIVLVIKATVKANQGEEYHYPLTIRFIK